MKKEVFTPADLAKLLGVSDEKIRAWLRATHPRHDVHKNTPWLLNADLAAAVLREFRKRQRS